MPFTPAGYLAIPLAYLRATLAASATWQQLTGNPGDAAAAKLRIHPQVASDELVDGEPVDRPVLVHPRPRAVVITNEDFQRVRGGSGEWHPEGTLNISFEITVPEQYKSTPDNPDLADEFFWVATQLGAILSEMEILRDGDTAGSYLPFDRIAIVQDIMPCADDVSSEDFWGAEFQFFFQ